MFRSTFTALVAGTCFLVGCTPGSDNSAAELEGVWRLNFEEPGDLEGYDIQATFNSRGQLTEINATSPEGGSARLEVSNNATTTVNGHDVTITIPRAGGTTVFEGVISDDHNSIEGNLSETLELPSGDISVTLPGSGLTLVRIEA